MGTSRLVDVSAYQGPQDWAAWKQQGVVGGFAKASEGQHTHDARFAMHVKGIKAAGLVPGGYHFAWPNQNVVLEADNYISAVRPYAGKGFTHWLDLERYSDGRNYAGRSSAQILAWVKAWLAAVEKAFPGQRVGVYTSASDIAAGHVPAGVTLWYPAYPGTRVDTYAEAEKAARPRPSGRSPLIWQFTSDPAGPPHIDESIAYLSPADFRAWADGTLQEDDMQLGDQVPLGDWVPKHWPSDTGLADKKIPVWVTLGSGYAHSRIAHENSDKIVAMLAKMQAQEAAQTAAITAMAQALAKVDAAVDVAGLVATVQQAVTDAATKALEGLDISIHASGQGA